MQLEQFLQQQQVPYRKSTHSTAFTAQQLAASEHVSGYNVVKAVLVKADDEMVMCALPAPKRLSLESARETLGAAVVRLATEEEMAARIPDCELGAEPPIGKLFNMPTLMDQELQEDEFVVFQAGTHREAVRMSTADYIRLCEPKVADLTIHF